MSKNIGLIMAIAKAVGGSADPAVIEQAVTDWLNDHPEATTTVQDGSITEAKLAADVLAELGEIDTLKEAIENIEDDLSEYDEKEVDSAPTGWRLNESDGLCSADAAYQIKKFTVTAGQVVKVVSDDRFQFQTVASVPSYGTSNRVGQTYGTGTFVLTVPETATYLIVSTTVAESTANAYDRADRLNGMETRFEEAIGNKPDTDLFKKCVLVTEMSKNRFNKDDAQTGYLHTNGTVYTGGGYDSYCYASLGTVQKGDTFKFWDTTWGMYAATAQMVVAYDSQGTVMPSSGATQVQTYTVPDGVASIKVTINGSGKDKFMAIANDNTTPSAYIPYSAGDQYYVAGDEFIPKSQQIDINIPSKLYALVGIEMNVYFENIVEEWEKYKWDCTCDVGKQMERCFTVTPISTDAGNHTLTITATADDGTVTTATTTLMVVATSAGDGTTETVILLGDSTTNYGIVEGKLLGNFEDDPMSITLAGTRGTSPNFHEGRDGWTLERYCTLAQDPGSSSIVNPFFNPTSQKFDAGYYFANSGVTGTDWLMINLGINDVFGITSDTALASKIEDCFDYLDGMIESIHEADENIKIGVCLTIPPNHSQDAFGKAYNCGQNRNRYKRNNAKYVKALIDEYDNRTAEGIYLVPIHVNLDTVYNMGMETISVNARNTGTTYSSPVGNGGVHPAESGYWQIADVYTAIIKAYSGN